MIAPASASELTEIVAAELQTPVEPAVQALAEAARKAHEPAASAVLFYGSCLRDGYREGMLVDLYVLVDDYAAVHRSRLMRWLNRLVPPNVYYLETSQGGAMVRAKYALVSLDQFERRMMPGVTNPYFWARFAQPTGLLWARDAVVRERVVRAIAQAIVTTEQAARPLVGASADPETLWTRALSESYRTELRAEKPHRARAIVEHDRARWRQVTAALATSEAGSAGGREPQALARWRWRRIEGKALSMLRLIKASFTFAGGGDYIAYKINRHAEAPIEFSTWERRHPLLAAPFVLWRLARRGVVR